MIDELNIINKSKNNDFSNNKQTRIYNKIDNVSSFLTKSISSPGSSRGKFSGSSRGGFSGAGEGGIGGGRGGGR